MKTEILALKHKECVIVPESDYGKVEIWRINDMFILFDIPMYGSKPMYYQSFRLDQIDYMINVINGWT